jgi:hypothetical protein
MHTIFMYLARTLLVMFFFAVCYTKGKIFLKLVAMGVRLFTGLMMVSSYIHVMGPSI